MSEFDVIIEHLIEQGFPVEEALKLMVNMSEEKREQILEMKHRDAKTGEVVDKPEIGKIYYPHGERKKSSVALRKEKEAAEKKTQKEEVEQIDEIIDPKGAARIDAAKKKKKVDVFAYDRKLQAQGKLKGKKLPPPPTNKESFDSLSAAYQSVFSTNVEEIAEEESDALKDRHLERAGHTARTDYTKAPKGSKGSEKSKKYDGMSALEKVKADLRKKYGDKSIK